MPLDTREDLPDEVLLARFASGDASATRSLTARHLPRVFNHAVRLIGDRAEAEDVAQDVMMRLWRVAARWRPGEARISTWLYRVTANLCIDRRRMRRGIGLGEIAEPADPTPSAASGLQQRARHDALQTALDALPDRQRQAVVLRHIEGLANPEIAQIMQINLRAVESLTARGKVALTAHLAGRRAELGYEDDET